MKDNNNLKTKSKIMIGLYSILGIIMVGLLFVPTLTSKGTYSNYPTSIMVHTKDAADSYRSKGYGCVETVSNSDWYCQCLSPNVLDANGNCISDATPTPSPSVTPVPTKSCKDYGWYDSVIECDDAGKAIYGVPNYVCRSHENGRCYELIESIPSPSPSPSPSPEQCYCNVCEKGTYRVADIDDCDSMICGGTKSKTSLAGQSCSSSSPTVTPVPTSPSPSSSPTIIPGGNGGSGGNGGGSSTTSNKDIKIYYNTAGGTVTGKSNYSLDEDDWVTFDNNEWVVQTCKSGSTCNIWNYNGDNWSFKKDGYIAKKGEEWKAKKKDNTFVSLNQTTNYTYDQMVSFARTEHDSYYGVWLYVNWVKEDSSSEDKQECYVCKSNGKEQYVKATNATNAASAATNLSGITSSDCTVTSEANCGGTVVSNCYECNGSKKHVMATSEAEAKTKSGGTSCTIVTTDKCNDVTPPKTGTAGIIVAWIVGLLTIGYSVWYFKKSSSIK